MRKIPMSEAAIPAGEFHAHVQPLLGLPVSLPWKGYGSAIFLELGEMTPVQSKRLHYAKGQACISVKWDWRVQTDTSVLYGSSNSGPQIASNIVALQGTTVHSISVFGQVPELVVEFANGLSLRSMVMVTGDPEWSIRLPDKRYIYARDGSLFIGRGGVGDTTEEEETIFALEEETASRWGVPAVEPKRGSCSTCASFVYIDGQGYLLDYGVCTAAGGPFDGRIVNRNSGCPAFTSSEDT